MPHTVLIVDDDSDLLPSLVITLEELTEFRVLSANNGRSALEIAVAAHPDCVVIDVCMPELDGYQLTRALRGDPATAQIPLVMLTAMALASDRMIGLAAGCDHYLVKPVLPQTLITTIRGAIALEAAERQRRLEFMADN